MKFRIPNRLSQNIPTIVRKVGYKRIFDHKTSKESFVRLLTNNRYPRFHLYIKQTDKESVFDLHLDQTKTIYARQTAHNADYESEEVKNELTRIFLVVKQFIQ